MGVAVRAFSKTASLDNGAEIVRALILTGFVFVSGIAICVVIRPAGLLVNDGFSYYANYSETAIPFLATMVIAASRIHQIGKRLESESGVAPSTVRTLGLLLIVIALTPSKLNLFFEVTHDLAALALFGIELTIAFRLLATYRRVRALQLLLAAQAMAGVLTIMSFFTTWGSLIFFELNYQLAFIASLATSALLKSPNHKQAMHVN